MNRWAPLALALLPMFLLSGCANVLFHEQDRLAMGGKYAEIAGTPQTEKTTKAESVSPNNAGLAGKCLAYSKLKTYDKLFSCIEQMESNIAKGDTIIEHHGLFSWNYPENIVAMPGLLRAEALIDFGEYDKSASLSRAIHESLPGIEWTSKDTRNSWQRRFRIRALGLLSLAMALKGERERAEQSISELATIEASAYEFWLTPGGVSTAIAKEKRFVLARAHMALGNYDKVIEDPPDFWEAFGALSEGLLGYSLFAYIDLPKAFMKSKALYETGKINEAKSGYDRLLSQPESRSNGEIYWQILHDRGRIAEAEGQVEAAIGFYRQAIDVIEGQRSSINTEASKIGFVGDKQSVYGRLVALLVAQAHREEAFDYVERSKSRSLVDLLASKKDFASKEGAPEEVRKALVTLNTAELASYAQDGSAPREERSGVRSLRVAHQQIRQLAPELSTLLSVSSIPVAELRQRIGADETLVEYYQQDAALYAFVLGRDRLHAIKLESGGMNDEISAFRSALTRPESTDWKVPAQALYQRLWQPLEPLIAGSRVVIVAHGALHYLPFAALQRTDGAFLIDFASMRMLPSASVLKFLNPLTDASPARLLVLGNPDLGDSRLDLEFAGEEARLIAGSQANAQLWMRKEASETNFKNSGKNYARIHFASHGKFNADSPLESGLYLARDATNDGVLTVGELYSMTLNADLVTLSACETGLGKVARGDDVVGLARGFLYAGSRSIVASLWSVDDEATGILMKRLYDNLKKIPKDESLRQAQIKTRQQFPHPYYWAAFQLSGRAD